MGERESAANATVSAAAAAPRPSRQGQRSHQDTAVADPDIEHRKAGGSCAPIEHVERFIFVVVDDADDKVHAAGNISVHQPNGSGPERSS
jgi:hypothetical protein